jgi:cytochrome P450
MSSSSSPLSAYATPSSFFVLDGGGDYVDMMKVLYTLLAATFAMAVSSFLLRKKATSKTPWPKVPGRRFIIGNPLGDGGIDNLCAKFDEWIINYGDVPSNPTGLLECALFGQTFLLVCNNGTARQICQLRPNKIQRPQSEVNAVNSVGAFGVFSSNGKTWNEDRRIMAPPLNQKNLADYVPFVQQITGRLIAKWTQTQQADGHVTINQDIMSIMIDYIGKIAFDEDYDCLRRRRKGTSTPHEATDLQHMFRTMASRALSPINYWNIPFVGQYLDGFGYTKDRLIKKLNRTLDSYASENNNNNNERSKTYLKKLLDQKDSRDMSKQRIVGNLMTMFAAGSETTGNTVMICLWELLKDDIDDDMISYRNEIIDEVLCFTDSTGGIGLDSPELTVDVFAKSIPKLRAYFYEIVRYTGTAPQLFLSVAAEAGVQIDDVWFPKGTDFLLPLEYLGKQDDSGIPFGPNAERPAKFCPRRWLSKEKVVEENGKRTDEKWIVTKPSAKSGVSMSSGFGNGVRICPGQSLAELEATYLLARILTEFDVKLTPNHPPVKLISSFTVSPNIDINLVLTPRQ